jgi:plastocyanin
LQHTSQTPPAHPEARANAPGEDPRTLPAVIRSAAAPAEQGDDQPRSDMNKRILLPLLGLALATALFSAGIAGAATKTVTLKHIAFSPKSLTIHKGSTVTFAFRDDTTVHNVTSTGAKRFKTIGNRSSGSKSRTFSRAGTYRYHCTLHPGMSGRIVVN